MAVCFAVWNYPLRNVPGRVGHGVWAEKRLPFIFLDSSHLARVLSLLVHGLEMRRSQNLAPKKGRGCSGMQCSHSASALSGQSSQVAIDLREVGGNGQCVVGGCDGCWAADGRE